MFDETIRTIRAMGGQTRLSVSIQDDEEGYFDRKCPADECLFQFKILSEDWKNKVRDEEVFCPSCRHTASSGQWWTQQQIEHAKKAAISHISGQINRAMVRDAAQWNRQQPRGSLISITMNVNNHPTQVLLPPAAAEPMRLKITCPACECRYAVIGAAFFCPACGYNAADQQFMQSIIGITQSLDALDFVRLAIEDRDAAENTVRLVVESGLQTIVTAFQRYAEALYTAVPNASQARRNAFQNLSEGSDLWKVATGKSYADHIMTDEIAILQKAFQQRHLLAHTQGIVDAAYQNKSGDNRYQIGQRIVIREESVREAARLITKLAGGLLADCQSVRA
ncbi:hypothetical protein [Candidatus Magnetaquicoccus inordinatus]|uniref:hypothetical protein n=1 Tax=Candidatus Magnetaquicoccus inordinatus TaxID=2496818 RepID=UPI00102BF045|nr:hypothetical protein [Candidatus Magnetaquicoccus inordinatus]